MTDQLHEIRNAIDNNDIDRARELLRDALKNPTAGTYYLASQVALSDSQRISFLEKALELDPFHQQAADVLGGATGAAIPPQNEYSREAKADSGRPTISQDVTGESQLGQTEPISLQFPIILFGASAIASILVYYLEVNFGGGTGVAFFWLGLCVISLILLIRFLRKRPLKSHWSFQLEQIGLWLPYSFLLSYFVYFGPIDVQVFFFLLVPLILGVICALSTSIETESAANTHTSYKWWRPTILMSLGLLAGIAFGNLIAIYDIWQLVYYFIVGIVVLFSLGLLIIYLRKGAAASILYFELELITLWIPFIAWTTFIFATVDEYQMSSQLGTAIGLGFIFWLVTAVSCFVMLFFGKPQQELNRPVENTE